MLKPFVVLASALLLAMPIPAQEGPPATVTSVDRDRSGRRFANRWQVRCDSAGQVWKTGPLNRATRKMFVQAGAASLRVGTAGSPASIQELLNGSAIVGWSTLAAGAAQDYGNPIQLVVVCTGPGSFYAHAEWNRRQTSLFGL